MKLAHGGAAAAALLVAFAGGAQAEMTYSGAVTLGYGFGEVNGGGANGIDVELPSLDAAGTIGFGKGFALDLGASMSRLSFDGTPLNLDLDAISAAPKYTFSSGLTLGLFYERDSVNAVMDQDFETYGVSAGYTFGALELEGFYGEVDTDPSIGAGVDFDAFGLGATYLIGDAIKVGGSVVRNSFDGAGVSGDIDMYKVGAAFQATDAFTLFGGASYGVIDQMGFSYDLKTVGLGAAYDMSAMATFPLIASAEFVHSDIVVGGPSAQANMLKFGFTIPFGDKAGPVAPLNSVASSTFDLKYNTFSDLYMGAF